MIIMLLQEPINLFNFNALGKSRQFDENKENNQPTKEQTNTATLEYHLKIIFLYKDKYATNGYWSTFESITLY